MTDTPPKVDAAAFLGLLRTDDLTWKLPVSAGIATPGRFLFGGCALAASVEAMEQASGRRLVWATAQYLSYAERGSVVDLSVTLATVGHQVTQARTTGLVGDREIFTVNAALGQRVFEREGTWERHPDVLRPELCPVRPVDPRFADTIQARLELRIAAGRLPEQLDERPGSGRCALWIDLSGVRTSSAALAIIGDFVPFGIAQALGIRGGGNSLDNTLRLARVVPTGWVLLDVHVHAVVNGFGHGTILLWAEDGTLLGTASQSTIVRRHRLRD